MTNFSQLSDTLSHWIEFFLPWITQYGSIALFFLLALGIIALPIPDEWLLVSAGYLIGKGVLNGFTTTIASIMGAWSGISVSYLLGFYLGPYVFSSRIGTFLGLQNKRLKAQHWFQRIGKWSLVIGYFIPGVRHFVGYIAGSLDFPYRRFALYAYTGGAVWASLFLTLGYNIHQNNPFIMQTLERVQHFTTKYLFFFSEFFLAHPTLIALILGMLGMTATYILGLYTGRYVISHRNVRLHMDHYLTTVKADWNKVSAWGLVIGSFIPGIRYIVSYLAGTISFSYRQFALYAYAGVAISMILFSYLGYGLHPKHFLVLKLLKYIKATFFKTA